MGISNRVFRWALSVGLGANLLALAAAPLLRPAPALAAPSAAVPFTTMVQYPNRFETQTVAGEATVLAVLDGRSLWVSAAGWPVYALLAPGTTLPGDLKAGARLSMVASVECCGKLPQQPPVPDPSWMSGAGCANYLHVRLLHQI